MIPALECFTMRNKRHVNDINVVYFTCYWDVKPAAPAVRCAPSARSSRLARLQPCPASSYQPSATDPDLVADPRPDPGGPAAPARLFVLRIEPAARSLPSGLDPCRAPRGLLATPCRLAHPRRPHRPAGAGCREEQARQVRRATAGATRPLAGLTPGCLPSPQPLAPHPS